MKRQQAMAILNRLYTKYVRTTQKYIQGFIEPSQQMRELMLIILLNYLPHQEKGYIQ